MISCLDKAHFPAVAVISTAPKGGEKQISGETIYMLQEKGGAVNLESLITIGTDLFLS
jgi:hypothetical protein